MTGLTLKERLGERLAEYPLLRTMLLNPWFALALIGSLVAGVAVVACLPKVWRSTPAGFRPEVRVSLLDYMQAWALRAAAERDAARGDHLAATAAWQSAVGNDAGNLELYRGAWKHLRDAPELPRRNVGRILANSGWLLLLGGTNRTDVELMASVYDKYNLPADVYRLLTPIAADLPVELEAAYLRSLFWVGRYAEFGTRWEQVKDRLPPEPVMALYRAAFEAGWGSPAGAEEKVQRLKRALDDVLEGPVAARLLMSVSRQRLDPVGFAQGLEREREASRDRISDHVSYWRLLDAVGRKEEARRLAKDFNREPELASDVVLTAEALMTLGLGDECLGYLQRYAREFGADDDFWSAAVWATYADLLTTRRDWEGLKEVATQMRSISEAHRALVGFSLFLEGRVAFANGATSAAEETFREAVAAGFPLGRVGISVGNNLRQMGYPELALQALLPLEPLHGKDLGYWGAVFEAAYDVRKDETLLLKAAWHAHELDPNSLRWRCNYAAALLIGQWRPEEALRVTLAIHTQLPNLAAGQINHVFALVLNGRTDEAAGLLDRIELPRLTESEQGAYYLSALAVHRALEDWPAVSADLKALQNERLFPKQERWLEEIRRALPEAVAPQAGRHDRSPRPGDAATVTVRSVLSLGGT